ncbi:MAG: oxidoreductase, partial [Leptospirales bacterium]
FVATEATENDGVPAPNEISAEEAAVYILKGIRKEKREHRFPRGTALAVRVGRLAPGWLRARTLLAEAADEY